MSRQIAAAVVTAMVCVACGRSQDNRNMSNRTSAAPMTQIKVTGCLQPSEQAVGTAGTSASAVDTKYMLTHARSEAAQPQSSTDAAGASVAERAPEREPARTQGTQGGSRTGTSSTARTDAAATTRDSARTQGTQGGSLITTYRLDGDDNALGPEIGHKVEIVAIVDESGSIGRQTTDTSSNGVSSMPKVKVQSIRMIATNCPSE